MAGISLCHRMKEKQSKGSHQPYTGPLWKDVIRATFSSKDRGSMYPENTQK